MGPASLSGGEVVKCEHNLAPSCKALVRTLRAVSVKQSQGVRLEWHDILSGLLSFASAAASRSGVLDEQTALAQIRHRASQ